MSSIATVRSQYSDRLNRIQEELLLTDAAIRFVKNNLNTPEISRMPEFAPKKLAMLSGLEKRLEATYFIRLTAEFEGIMKDYLSEYQTSIKIPDNANFDWLISRVFRPKRIIQSKLRVQIDEVRTYRNALAHRGADTRPLLFATALQRINKLIKLLPEPQD